MTMRNVPKTLDDRPLRAWMQQIASDVSDLQAVPATTDTWDVTHLVKYATASMGTIVPTGVGMVATGFTNAAVPAATNLYTSTPRTLAATAAALNSQVVGAFVSTQYLWFGNAAGLGGFYFRLTFGLNAINATTRLLAGLTATAAPALNVQNPSAVTNGIWVGLDDTDTTLVLMNNDAAGVATRTALGVGFPNTAATGVYRLELTALANTSSVAYAVTRLDDTSVLVASGTLTTDIPSNTTFLQPTLAVGNGAAGAVVSVALVDCMTIQTLPR